MSEPNCETLMLWASVKRLVKAVLSKAIRYVLKAIVYLDVLQVGISDAHKAAYKQAKECL